VTALAGKNRKSRAGRPLPIRERDTEEAGRQLEYDFILAPGANPNAIELRFDGAAKLTLNRDGDVVATLPDGGKVIQHLPAIYQERDGHREKIDGRCALRGKNTVGFALASYDRARAVQIDPTLLYASYLGGSGNDQANGIAVDSAGNAYVAGYTASSNFPTTAGAYQTANAGGGDAFIAKLNPNASGAASLIYSTYLGGSGNDEANGIAVDSAGDAYITGLTASTNFPVTGGAYRNSLSGGNDAFVSELDSAGATLLYSTYLGGSANDQGNGIAVDSSGNAYVTGTTYSSSFPTVNAYQATNNDAAHGNAFAAKLDPSASGAASLVYSTYLGGSGNPGGSYCYEFLGSCLGPSVSYGANGDYGYGIAVDSAGEAYVVGQSSSSNFAGGCPSASCDGSGFIVKLNSSGNGLLLSEQIGGNELGVSPKGCNGLMSYWGSYNNARDTVTAVALDSAGDAYVTGQSDSLGWGCEEVAYPEAGTCGTPWTVCGAPAAFVKKIGGTGFEFGIGGTDSIGNGIAVDSAGEAYVAGKTIYTNGEFIDFVDKINSAGNALIYSTSLDTTANGGTDTAIAVDSAGDAYITGGSNFGGFLTLNAYQSAPAGAEDAVMAEIDDATNTATATPTRTPTPTATISPTPTATPTAAATTTIALTGPVSCGSVVEGSTTSQSVTVKNSGRTNPLFIGGFVLSDTNDFTIFVEGCPLDSPIAANTTCPLTISCTPQSVGIINGNLTVTANTTASPQSFALSVTGLAPPNTTDSIADNGGTGSAPTYPTANFGTVAAGSAQTMQVITIKNTGRTNPLVFQSVSLTANTANNEYSIVTTTCPAAPTGVTAGTSCTVTVGLTPNAGDTTGTMLNGTLSVFVNSVAGNSGAPPSEEQDVPLTATVQ
ncbi:MAG: SBBP repeat-containing protein, partial [Candidatus Binataceae bacterium]